MDSYQRWKYRRRKEREAYNAGRNESFGNDYYERLGLSRNATREQIEAAWREASSSILSRGGDCISAVRLLHEAYKVLSDPAARRIYDLNLRGNVNVPKGSYYQKLGISINATEADIKSAWRRAAKQWHPDVCDRDDAAAMFRELNAAYLVLSCPVQRVKYDREIGYVD